MAQFEFDPATHKTVNDLLAAVKALLKELQEIKKRL
jgi:hypothetical protein